MRVSVRKLFVRLAFHSVVGFGFNRACEVRNSFLQSIAVIWLKEVGENRLNVVFNVKYRTENKIEICVCVCV